MAFFVEGMVSLHVLKKFPSVHKTRVKAILDLEVTVVFLVVAERL